LSRSCHRGTPRHNRLTIQFPASTISLSFIISLSEQPYAFQRFPGIAYYRNSEALLVAGGKLSTLQYSLTIGGYFTIFGFKEQDGKTFDSHKSLYFLT
jgi:hypothetical protein